jgi:hypothetical protein
VQVAYVLVEVGAESPDLLWGTTDLMRAQTELGKPAEIADQEQYPVAYQSDSRQCDEYGP